MTRVKTIVFSIFTITLLLGCTSKPVALTEVQSKLTIGSKVPQISAIGIDGVSKSLQDLSKKKGLVLILHRSAEWCPFCKGQLRKYNDWSEEFNSKGYGLAAISYDSISTLKAFTEEESISYPLISDQNYQTFKDWGVLNQSYEPDDDIYGISYPGVLVIDSSQKLLHKIFYQGYKNRANAETVLNLLN